MIAAVLIGFGIGALIATGYNYKTSTHRGLIPTKVMLILGLLSLAIGILIQVNILQM